MAKGVRRRKGAPSWAKLLSDNRLPKPKVADKGIGAPDWLISSRTEIERDFDRILFATPTRRLGDKTQVFPLEKNESVRTRLTHSHEVSALARSIGTYLAHSKIGDRIVKDACNTLGEESETKIRRAIPSMLAAIGLAHDLGNPPFGHQGEEAIRAWVNRNSARLFARQSLTKQHKSDFLSFEGNAQTLRTVARLQVVKDDRGLNLTMGTLAALMKYTVSSTNRGGKNGPAACKKVGFFASEGPLVEMIHEETGLGEGLRHPLTYIMEACDDIAYSVVDAEDAVKKQIVSFSDLTAWLRNQPDFESDDLSKYVVTKAEEEASTARQAGLPPAEVNDVATQMFRVHAIGAMISAAVHAFEERFDDIATGTMAKPLLEASTAHRFCEALKKFDFQHAYQHRRVLEIELSGFNIIHDLMDMLWRGITEREKFEVLSSRRTSPFARYAYGRISENYRRVFEGRLENTVHNDKALPIRYKELQLLTDMISGMTDQYAVDLRRELGKFNVGASASDA
jgi:dGTPase